MKRRGFTMVELIVVISIIAILSGLLVMGVGKLHTSAKRRQTEQMLENCRAMYGDYDAAKHFRFSSIGSTPCPANVTTEVVSMSSYPYFPQYRRFGDAVLFTRDIMFQIRAMPTNASALSKMPADALMVIPPSLIPPSPAWLNGGHVYVAYDRVSDGGTPATYYTCIQGNQSSDGTGVGANPPPANNPPNPFYWYPQTSDSTVPVILDGWGNPIIFVPSSLGSGAVLNADGSIPPNKGILKAGDRSFNATSSDGRPFWASAGPDGDFSLGDDNLYSFEK